MTVLEASSPRAISVRFSNRSSRIGMLVVAVALLFCATAPLWADRSSLRLYGEIYTYVALASLWNLLAGYAGLVSVGQQAFVGLGGYVLFLLALNSGLNPLIGIPIAGLVSGLIAIPIIFVLLRLRGAYFTIGSWVVAEIFPQVFQQIPAVGGASGISLPAAVVKSIAASRDTREWLIYWLALAMAVLTIGAIVALLRTRWGLALAAIRDNELAARSNGMDVNRTRVVVFVAAAVATGMVGSLIFLQKLTVTPVAAFSINDWTVNIIFITVIGGIGRVEGPVIGTAVFFLLRQFLADFGSIYIIVLGVVAIAIMLKAPRGLWGFLADRYGWQVFPLTRRVVFRN
ncbi:amino acid/amide ABC transporter membrane protein 2, HAAT family [Faunimonas pinastri]|uniref:Amino acid/amide ABC transporter membrane protein 2, HAAT family n=1 Tax=Faunimonas pinastri TaxID=1855383 RepID=A0A1H9E3P9_9HYPH|nr:branched-chain amino acid ABC transporter permease [Faunimonas pinastri]SEQ20366.1 amino acid/amide ABC transporter membrane protein 2, HAAT family [Faunimonas pinastri]